MPGFNERPVPQLYRPAASIRIRPKTAANFVQECHRPYAEAHGCALTMDVFRPLEAANGFGVIDVVSGGWYGDRIQLNEHVGMGFIDALCARGFTVFTGPISSRLGFHENRANILLEQDGMLTGEVAEPILGKQAKVDALLDISARLGIDTHEAIAVGDGANDLGMLELAGSGVALHAKPSVAAQAKIRIDHGDLTALLYLQGYRKTDFVTP